MKLLLKSILTTFIVLGSLTSFTVQVFATTYESTSCDINTSPFTVDQLSNNSGSIEYTSQGCYNNYWDANTKFTELKDGGSSNIVIRYFGVNDSNFQSPLKIIKADRAMAYTQNDTYAVGNRTSFVSGGTTYYRAATINIYSDSALSSSYTYVDNNEPLYYYTSEAINPNTTVIPSNMNAYVEINGAKGYITLDGIDIIPYIYADANVLAPFYYKESTTSSKTLYQRPGRAPGIYISQPKYTTIGTEISLGVDRAITYDSVGIYTKAPSFMTNGSVYYSPDGIRFFSDYTLTNQVGTFYNYFNFLSLRTKTAITAAQFDTYMTNQNRPTSVMNGQGSTFISAQDSYGMNALLIYAMAIQESGYGTNTYSTTRYNLFSVNAIDSNPDEADYFTSVADSVNTQMGTILRYYMDINSTKFYGSNIGNKGAGFNTKYASDPFWSTKIAKYAYLIDKANGSAELNKLSLGLLKPQVSSTLYKDRNLSTSLYTIPTRAVNYPLTLTASYNNSYYTQSTSPISAGTLITNSTTGLISYDWTSSMAYLSKDQVTLINTPTQTLATISDTDQLLTKIQAFNWNADGTLYIKGRSVLNATAMVDINLTTHSLIFKNLKTNVETTFNLTVLPVSYNNYNGLTYNSVGFEGNLNLSTLAEGSYNITLKTTYGDTTGVTQLSDPSIAPYIPDNKVESGTLQKLVLDSWNSMTYNYIKSTRLNNLSISADLPTDYMSFAKISTISVDANQLLSMTGITFINGVNMSSTNTRIVKLVLLSENDTSAPALVYDLLTNTGSYDPSISPNNYSHSWYSFSTPIDLTQLQNGTYKVLFYIESDGVKDIVEARDFSYAGSKDLTISTRSIQLEMRPNERRSFYLILN